MTYAALSDTWIMLFGLEPKRRGRIMCVSPECRVMLRGGRSALRSLSFIMNFSLSRISRVWSPALVSRRMLQ